MRPTLALRARRRIAALFVVATASLSAASAQANGRFPTAQQLVLQPGKPSNIVLRTTFGLLLSSDQGGHWDWICESAVGYPSAAGEDPAVGITAGGAVLAGVLEGLAVSPDTGCSWGFAGGGLAKKPVIDLAVRGGAPHAAVALASSASGTSDAGAVLLSSQLYATGDDGVSWMRYGSALDPTMTPTTVEVAASDAHRVYVSGVRGAGTTRSASLFVSLDDGTSFVEHPIPIDPAAESAAFVAAVDPTNADRIYVRTGILNTSRLLVSDDAGSSFRVVYAGGPMLGFALSSDGTSVFLGGPEDGVRQASTSDFSFNRISSLPVGCLALSGTTLYACVVQSSVLLAASIAGAPFAPLLRLTDLRGPLSCPVGTTTTRCASEWSVLQMQYGIGAHDAGVDAAGATTDGGPADAAAPASHASSLGGCSQGTAPTPALCLAGLGSAAGALVVLLRRRKASGRST